MPQVDQDPETKTNIWIRSLGCKVNLADSAAIVAHLDKRIFNLVDDPKLADIGLLTTCTVTHKADRDVRKILGSLKRDFPALPIIVSGCAVKSQRPALEKFDNVSTLIEPGNPQAVARACYGIRRENFEDRLMPTDDDGSRTSFQRLGRQRAFAKVQDGCNSECSYCIISKVRGPERSVELAQVVAQIDALTRLGHREVVLCGIHLGRYGHSLAPKISLSDLLLALKPVFDERGPHYRLRLSSIEPNEWTTELKDTIESLDFVCHHFHVPIQSGDDRILQLMNRPYRVRQYVDCIEDLKRRFPGAMLATDVLVGFPSEAQQAAKNTIDCVQQLPLANLHVFTYSARPNTRAAKMPDQVDPEVVRRRAFELRTMANSKWKQFQQKGIGHGHEVLLEKINGQRHYGRSREYRHFAAENTDKQPGEIVTLNAKSLEDDILIGIF
jgi:threonylcarbamoyladenosine tRNA methylthiotransferase MtaB